MDLSLIQGVFSSIFLLSEPCAEFLIIPYQIQFVSGGVGNGD
jgi:hypothetical protein